MTTTIAHPYAEALVQIGQERGIVDEIRESLDFLAEYLERNKDFRAFFESPRIDPEVKQSIVDKAFADKLSDPVTNLLGLLIEKSRHRVLPEIIETFRAMHDEVSGRLTVPLRTAKPIGAEATGRIADRLSKTLGREVILETEVDPALLGGIVLHVGDTVINGSLRHRLDVLGRRLRASKMDGKGFYED